MTMSYLQWDYKITMWQDEYISKHDNEYTCWDYNGEFITIVPDREQARTVITDYRDLIKRSQHGQVIRQLTSVKQ